MKTNNFKLFLDDNRDPSDGFLYDEQKLLLEVSDTTSCEWEVVRNYEDFCCFIDKFGLPSMVSFDHDLHIEHIRHYINVTQNSGVIEYGNLKHKTGKHCAEYFMEKWRAAARPKVKIYVHSANRWGQIEIKKVLKDALC